MTRSRPYCECGDCNSTGRPLEDGVPTQPEVLLPMDAWRAAGNHGTKAGPNGEDVIACAPGHVPKGARVVAEFKGWAMVA